MLSVPLVGVSVATAILPVPLVGVTVAAALVPAGLVKMGTGNNVNCLLPTYP